MGKTVNAVFCVSLSIPDTALYFAKQYAIMKTAGSPEEFFVACTSTAQYIVQPGSPSMFTKDKVPTDNQNRVDGITIFENQGFNVSNKNCPDKENDPTSDSPTVTNNWFYP